MLAQFFSECCCVLKVSILDKKNLIAHLSGASSAPAASETAAAGGKHTMPNLDDDRSAKRYFLPFHYNFKMT